MKTLRGGEIKRKRGMIAEMLRGCWESCIEPDPNTQTPFVANAIIANPVSFAHIHCAQALSIPLHMVFTMPWSPTRAFPHPLAKITNSSTEPKIANYLSYCLVQSLTWQGLGDIVNDFRKNLDLQALPTSEAPFIAETLRIPYTYCWSPALVPKPTDWSDHIDVSGFIFRKAPIYEPSEYLAKFLADGAPPVYVGFGSIVVAQPAVLLKTVLTAVQKAGVRAIVSKGWSELSGAVADENVFFLEDCPHEWLFQHVSAVVHHGGAGTTAAGLLYGRPTVVVPFFGDQSFWGEQIAAAGAGPTPINHKRLNASNLADAIKFCLTPEAAQAAAGIAERIRSENGVEAAAASFHRGLSTVALQCDLVPSLPAAYEFELKSGKTVKISAFVADTLLKHEKIKSKQLKSYEPKRIDIENRRWDPVTSATSSGVGLLYSAVIATNNIWYAPYKIRREAERKAKESASTDSGEGSSNGVMASDAAKMVGASALSVSQMYGVLLKGIVVDTPYAITEGFRSSPKLYGEIVPDHEPVTDWKSGAIVGGKEFAKGLGEGLVDLFVQPYKGVKEDGAKGFVMGVGKGALGTVTKIGAGGLGLWAYPAQGAWLSVRDATHQGTKKTILSARRVYDLYYARRDRKDEEQVLKAFEAL